MNHKLIGTVILLIGIIFLLPAVLGGMILTSFGGFLSLIFIIVGGIILMV